MSDISADALARLGRNALAFGKTYVELKNALIKQGVRESEARSEARSAAAIAAILDGVEEGAECPLCGGSGRAP